MMVIVLVISLSSTAILPFLNYSLNLWDSEGVTYIGEPISDSVFAEFIGDDGSSAIYPHAYDTRTIRPLVYETDYSEFVPQVMIDYDEALETAEDWLYRVGPDLISWSMFSHTNSTSPPSWTFYFTHVDFYAFVTVDAVTGSVIEYESKYLHDFDPTVLDLEEAETLVMNFLETENITLPNTARYIKGEPYDCQRFYSLVFQEYSGSVRVEDSQILARASAFTRGISYYKYSWVGIGQLDLTGVLKPIVAEQIALLQVPEISNVESPIWGPAEIALVKITPQNENSDRSWRLAWILSLTDETNDEYDAEVYADAFSGNTFGYRSSQTSYTDTIEMSSIQSTETLFAIGGISIALLGIVIVISLYRFKAKH